MSQIRYVGTPSDRVHRGVSRQAQKRQRWMYVPKQKCQVTWFDVKLAMECGAVTAAAVVALFFTWFYAGL